MLSRVAESIYWLGRYLERAENIARLVNVNANLMLDLPKGIVPDWEPLIRILGCEASYQAQYESYSERRVANYLITDTQYGGSIISSLGFARENVRTIRETLPGEAWEAINALYQEALQNRPRSQGRQGRFDYLRTIISGLQRLTGLLAGSMNHDTAYYFLIMGRKLERADMTSRIINVQAESPIQDDVSELKPFDDMLLMSMLESMSGYQMYRQSMQARISRQDVLTFLFKHAEFPRSMAYALTSLANFLSRLPNHEHPFAILAQLVRVVEEASMHEMDGEVLTGFVDQLQIRLGDLHNAIAETYFPAVVDETPTLRASAA